MKVERLLPTLLLAPVSAARTSTVTSRTVDVVLGPVSIAYTAASPVALPHGVDLRVLLALLEHASDDGRVQLTVPALLQAADLGAGGRQHAALHASLDRLQEARYTVTRAPSSLHLPAEFTLVTAASLSPTGVLHVDLGAELAAQNAQARTRPVARRLPDIPSSALALYGVLELLARLPGGTHNGEWRLPVGALCELLGLASRGDNARRTLLTLTGALQEADYLSGARVEGVRAGAQLVLTDTGPDASVVALLCREGVSRAAATTWARDLGDLVPLCLQRARAVRREREQRGDPIRSWPGLIVSVLQDPGRYQVRPPAPVVQLPVAPAPSQPESEPDAGVVATPKGVISMLKLFARGHLSDTDLQALQDRLECGLVDPGEVSAEISSALKSGTLGDTVQRLRSRLQAA